MVWSEGKVGNTSCLPTRRSPQMYRDQYAPRALNETFEGYTQKRHAFSTEQVARSLPLRHVRMGGKKFQTETFSFTPAIVIALRVTAISTDCSGACQIACKLCHTHMPRRGNGARAFKQRGLDATDRPFYAGKFWTMNTLQLCLQERRRLKRA